MVYTSQANLTIEDITMKNMWGTTSAKLDPLAGTLVCSAPDVSHHAYHLPLLVSYLAALYHCLLHLSFID